MSPEGKPIEVNASALQAAASQNAVGMFYKSNNVIKCLKKYSNFCYRFDDIIILA
jgi:hypothetical protein